MRLSIFLIFSIFATVFSFGQSSDIYMHPNHGQWDARILYNVELSNGNLYFDREGYTISLRNSNHHHDIEEASHEEESFNYALKIKYLNGNQNARFENGNQSSFYRSYFLGNDQSKWKSKIYSYTEVLRKDVYPGIDVQTLGNNEALEINYLLQSNADAQKIQIQYDGFSQLEIRKDGSFKMNHPLGTVTESTPIAWNVDGNGNKIKVAVRYKLTNNVISFEFPNGYNQNLPLVIDPILTFSTFTGSSSDNWGFTAAPDPQGNAFGGGICFGNSYPTTTGAYGHSFNGGNVDATISKFSSDGTQLLYSTYIGGKASETPHSIVSNAAGDIYVFGTTGSNNFPITANAFQSTFNLGSTVSANNISFPSGSDIYVLKLNAAGTNLLASTFVGGTGNDGVNLNALNYNYGDQFRGDITLDALGNVYVASTTYSTNFPIVGTSSTSNGGQDAVVFKMNGGLTSMLWSNYLGGSGFDAAYSIQVANDGSVYVAGGTTSSNFTFPNGIKTTTNGGTDGFIAKFNNNGQLLKGSFVGTSSYDQIYFLQLDLAQNIYVFGQTLGAMPITQGKYGQASSGQFIKKYDNTFSTELWSTLIGSGIKQVDISPTAFLVSDCYDIYFAGWGGSVNRNNSQAIHSSTTGLPITSDAYQSNTNGNNFYIGVLKPDAVGLKYGTFIGGVSSSANHVDGGTSRFDKSGKIYHSVCAACGGSPNGFTTTPGVYGPKNKSTNCNMAVFKFEISFVQTTITDINPVICYPDAITFNNVTTSGGTFFWDFGDGATSTQLNPSHTYSQPGTYTVSFVVKDEENCFISDTSKFDVTVKEFVAEAIAPSDSVCPNVGQQLQASGGNSYTWSPANYLNDPNIANPIAKVPTTTDFMVIVQGDECGIDTVYTTVHVFEDSLSVSNDTTLCIGSNITLSANGAIQYTWSPITYLDNPTIANPTATPPVDITYTVTGISPNNCPLKGTTNISIVFPPQPNMPDSVTICNGKSAVVQVSGASTYTWSPNVGISATQGSAISLSPNQSRYYYCDFSNACGTIRDSVFVTVISPIVKAWNDTTICPGQTAPLFASGASTYSWIPTVKFIDFSGSVVTAKPDATTTYSVTGTDAFGCQAKANVKVTVYPKPIVQANPDVYGYFDEAAQLGIVTNYPGTYSWSPAEYLSCTDCLEPFATPNRDYKYTITYIDTNGCIATDIIKVIYDPLLYIPNAFTPDGNGTNEVFRIYGANIDDITLDIYDRWGELIHTIKGFDDYWDGTYKGLPCPIGTYVWKIEYTDIVKDIILSKTGHVNIVR